MKKCLPFRKWPAYRKDSIPSVWGVMRKQHDASDHIHMPETIFEERLCKGCGLCVSVCPKKIIKLDTTRVNIQGYYPAMINNMAECIGCAACAKMCPDSVITVKK